MHKRDKAQAGLNGSGTIAKNIWIVKPGAKSRGRGIATFNNLPKLKYIMTSGALIQDGHSKQQRGSFPHMCNKPLFCCI